MSKPSLKRLLRIFQITLAVSLCASAGFAGEQVEFLSKSDKILTRGFFSQIAFDPKPDGFDQNLSYGTTLLPIRTQFLAGPDNESDQARSYYKARFRTDKDEVYWLVWTASVGYRMGNEFYEIMLI